jgi:hypothetical protein
VAWNAQNFYHTKYIVSLRFFGIESKRNGKIVNPFAAYLYSISSGFAKQNVQREERCKFQANIKIAFYI